MGERLGFMVAEVNQASRIAEVTASDNIHRDREDAQHEADYCREDTRRAGRGERYLICELVLAEEDV